MTIQWLYLFAALALLLPPLPFSPALERVLLKTRGGGLSYTLAATRVWQNWVDFFRAAVGVLILSQWGHNVSQGSQNSESMALGLEAAFLAIVLLVQTVRRLRTFQILAPVFYLCGLTLALGGWLQGGFAVVVGWLFAIAGKNLAFQLPAMAVALATAGYVLGLALPVIIVNCVLIFVPFVLATLFKKRLLFVANPALI